MQGGIALGEDAAPPPAGNGQGGQDQPPPAEQQGHTKPRAVPFRAHQYAACLSRIDLYVKPQPPTANRQPTTYPPPSLPITLSPELPTYLPPSSLLPYFPRPYFPTNLPPYRPTSLETFLTTNLPAHLRAFLPACRPDCLPIRPTEKQTKTKHNMPSPRQFTLRVARYAHTPRHPPRPQCTMAGLGGWAAVMMRCFVGSTRRAFCWAKFPHSRNTTCRLLFFHTPVGRGVPPPPPSQLARDPPQPTPPPVGVWPQTEGKRSLTTPSCSALMWRMTPSVNACQPMRECEFALAPRRGPPGVRTAPVRGTGGGCCWPDTSRRNGEFFQNSEPRV